jgi:NADP-dependent 3-hydroxy acid dehydrogenase YdfG
MARTHQLTGSTVLVTGAARGIGLATAERFAAAGVRVVLGDLDDDLVDKAARTIGRGALGLRLDVADRGSFAAFVERAQAEVGPVDVLVNNAGIMPIAPLVEESDDATDRIIDVNLRGVVTGTKLVVPGMVARGRGHVVNVASGVGRIALAHGATYSASKYAVVGFTEAMRTELRPHGVDVSAVLPTVVATELGSGLQATRGMRPCRPEEVAATIVAVAQRPRFETWVPRHAKAIYYGANLLPRRAKDVLARSLGTDDLLAHADDEARSGYEQRAARS